MRVIVRFLLVLPKMSVVDNKFLGSSLRAQMCLVLMSCVSNVSLVNLSTGGASTLAVASFYTGFIGFLASFVCLNTIILFLGLHPSMSSLLFAFLGSLNNPLFLSTGLISPTFNESLFLFVNP